MSELDINIIRNVNYWAEGADALVSKAARYVWGQAPEGAARGRLGELAIILSDNAQLQLLNRKWRGKDKPTNVLSFASEAAEAVDPDLELGAGATKMPRLLGDIMLARETVLQEAELQGKVFEHHLMHLVMHGVLHLLGYDHMQAKEAEKMEALETTYLAAFGISDPYLERFEAPE